MTTPSDTETPAMRYHRLAAEDCDFMAGHPHEDTAYWRERRCR